MLISQPATSHAPLGCVAQSRGLQLPRSHRYARGPRLPVRAQPRKEGTSDTAGDSGLSRNRPAIANREFLQAALRSEKGVGLVILAVFSGALQSLGKGAVAAIATATGSTSGSSSASGTSAAPGASQAPKRRPPSLPSPEAQAARDRVWNPVTEGLQDASNKLASGLASAFSNALNQAFSDGRSPAFSSAGSSLAAGPAPSSGLRSGQQRSAPARPQAASGSSGPSKIQPLPSQPDSLERLINRQTQAAASERSAPTKLAAASAQSPAPAQQPSAASSASAAKEPESRIKPAFQPAAAEKPQGDAFPYMRQVKKIAADINNAARGRGKPTEAQAQPAQAQQQQPAQPKPATASAPASRIRPGPEPAAGRSKADDFPYMRDVAKIAADVNAESAAKKAATAAQKPAPAAQKPDEKPAAPAQKPPASRIRPGPEPAAGRSKADDFPYMRDVAKIAADVNAESAAKKSAQKPAAPAPQPAAKPSASAQKPPAPAQKPAAANIRPGPEPAAGRSKADDFPYMRDVAKIAADINAESAAKKAAPAQQKPQAAAQKPPAAPAKAQASSQAASQQQPESRIKPAFEPEQKPKGNAFPYMAQVRKIASDISNAARGRGKPKQEQPQTSPPQKQEQKPAAASASGSRIRPGPEPAAGRSKADDFPYMRDVAKIAAEVNAESAAQKAAQKPAAPAQKPAAQPPSGSRIRPGPEPAKGRSKADDFPYMRDVAKIAADVNAEAAAKKSAQKPAAPAQRPAAQPAKAEAAKPQPASRIRPGPEPAAGRSKADDFPYMRNVAKIAADVNAESAAKKSAQKPAAPAPKAAQQPPPKPSAAAQKAPAPAQKPPAANIRPGPEPAAGRSKAEDFPYMRDVAKIAADINAESAAKKAAAGQAAPSTSRPSPPADSADSITIQQRLAKQAQADTAGLPANFSQGQGAAAGEALAGAKKLPVDPVVAPTPADDPAEGRKNFADAVQEAKEQIGGDQEGPSVAAAPEAEAIAAPSLELEERLRQVREVAARPIKGLTGAVKEAVADFTDDVKPLSVAEAKPAEAIASSSSQLAERLQQAKAGDEGGSKGGDWDSLKDRRGRHVAELTRPGFSPKAPSMGGGGGGDNGLPPSGGGGGGGGGDSSPQPGDGDGDSDPSARLESFLGAFLKALTGTSSPGKPALRPDQVYAPFILVLALAAKEWALRNLDARSSHDFDPPGHKGLGNPFQHVSLGAGLSIGTDEHGYVP